MAALIWTEPALSDLDAIADYIAVDNPQAAASVVKRIFAHVEQLAKHPKLGPLIPELRPRSRYRQLVESPCRIFYRYDEAADKVFIVGVMRFERHFRPRLLLRRAKPART